MFNYENHRSSIDNYIYHQSDNNLSYPLHLHNSYEFIYCYSGEIDIYVDNTLHILTAGNCLLVPPLISHSYTTKTLSSTYLCVFSYTFISDFYENYRDMQPVRYIFGMSNPTKLIDILMREENIYSIKSVLYQILSSLCKENSFRSNDSKDQHLIKRLIDYISDNFSRDITLSSLCDAFGFSYNYLSSFFMKYFNTSFCDMVNSYRIFKAQQLLHQTQISIIEVAHQCGFHSLRTFNRNFINLVKHTPSSYRTNMSNTTCDNSI